MTQSVYEIPLIAGAQTFSVTLSGNVYNMTMIYRGSTFNGVPANLCGYVLDIDDSLSNPIVHGIPLVTGVDLLAQYKYLDIAPGELVVYTDGNPSAPPTYSNLGSTAHLYYVVNS